MEPSDLKPTPPDDAQLEAWLRNHTSLAPLADDGFSTRVMGALPPPRKTSSNQVRVVVSLVGALAGTALAWSQTAGSKDFPAQLEGLAPLLARTLEILVDPSLSIALGVTLASLLYVYWREIRLLPRL